MQADSLQEAIAKYSDALRLNPDNPIYLTNRASAYLKLRKFKSCVQDCGSAIALDPKHWKVTLPFPVVHTYQAYLRRAEARIAQGMKQEAIPDLKEALTIRPRNRDIALLLEQCQQDVQESELEATVRRKVAESQEKDEPSEFAAIRSLLGRVEESKEDRQQALENLARLLSDGIAIDCC